jgi:hypothetical protein
MALLLPGGVFWRRGVQYSIRSFDFTVFRRHNRRYRPNVPRLNSQPHAYYSTSDFISTPSWLLRTIFGLKRPRSHLRRGGGGSRFCSHKSPRPFSEFKNIGFERSYGHFGPINIKFGIEPKILDTRFRHLLALNGRSFGIKAHLTVNPTPHRRLRGAGFRWFLAALCSLEPNWGSKWTPLYTARSIIWRRAISELDSIIHGPYNITYCTYKCYSKPRFSRYEAHIILYIIYIS